jgi:hypothetical protein
LARATGDGDADGDSRARGGGEREATSRLTVLVASPPVYYYNSQKRSPLRFDEEEGSVFFSHTH